MRKGLSPLHLVPGAGWGPQLPPQSSPRRRKEALQLQGSSHLSEAPNRACSPVPPGPGNEATTASRSPRALELLTVLSLA